LYKDRSSLIVERPASKTNGHEIMTHLVVSDLHIGFEEKFRSVGVRINPSIEKLSNRLSQLILTNRVNSLVINGDLKSSTDRISREEWENVPRFFDKLPPEVHVTLVKGNHDGGIEHLLPKSVKVVDSGGVMIEDILIMHGHTRPQQRFRNSTKLMMGHIHPIYQRKGSPISGQPVWVFALTSKESVFGENMKAEERENRVDDFELIVMPSFNEDLTVAGFANETAREERRTAPLIKNLQNVKQGIVVTLDGDLIGDASLIRSMF
jgi:putative SbcD/Mre11-related phosphoesterase